MDSLSVAIGSPHGGQVARKNIQLHFVPTVPARRHPFSPASSPPSPAFTMADLRVHDDRPSRSRWPILAFTMTDLAVHDGPILAFTMVRNSQCSRVAASSPGQRRVFQFVGLKLIVYEQRRAGRDHDGQTPMAMLHCNKILDS
jgi:hypothetical protein